MSERRISIQRNNTLSSLELQLWKRFFAFTIDSILIKFLIIPVLMAAIYLFSDIFSIQFWAIPTDEYTLGSSQFSSSYFTLSIVTFWIYSAIMESSYFQATLGKMFIGFKICKTNGSRMSFPQAIVRFFLKLLSIVTIIGIFIIDLNKNRVGLHDFLAKTRVIRRSRN